VNPEDRGDEEPPELRDGPSRADHLLPGSAFLRTGRLRFAMDSSDQRFERPLQVATV